MLQQGLEVRDAKILVLEFRQESGTEEITEGSLVPICACDFFPRVWLAWRIRQGSRFSH